MASGCILTYNERVSNPRFEQKQPRVGLIATLLATAKSYRGAGIHHYSSRLLEHLPGQRPSLHYRAYVADAAYRAPSGIDVHRAHPAAQKPWARILWEQVRLPLLLRQDDIDLVHGLAYAIPLATSAPSIVTVHDLSFLRHPQSLPRGNRLYLSRITALSCRRAQRIIAVSQATAAELHRLLGVPSYKITVIYNGVDARYFSRPRSEVERRRQQEGWPARFLLSVGTLEPRKNYVNLLKAYALYRRASASPLPLLIAGGKGWDYEAIFEQVDELGLRDDVHFLGFVPTETLPWLYNAAALFIYPSRYEGFGLPVAEAMACGAPTITSTVSSLPEVAGDAAATVDPDDVEGLAQTIIAILNDDERMQTMREAGFSQARQFQWTTTAAQTAALYARVLEANHG